MSDAPDRDGIDAGLVQQKTAAVVSQEEIDDVLGDASLSDEERALRLTDLRQRILDDDYARGDEEYAPLQVKIMDALSMLAEGGHDYSGTRHVEGEALSDRDAADE
ncbi:hypothetical protein GCM10011390_43600 [Aureimonas endophytica]|uniref:Uncharacterized protein n=1 Tax=Aureimonas endophytica TaxID=2027858 RepID=A0A916ZZ16_9HYPH|nr:hypothetical protein [Aureimonas endophytica]GGE19640.1 hypothetical protein GCM10011390_43600 [Aureimonas endophytica]